MKYKAGDILSNPLASYQLKIVGIDNTYLDAPTYKLSDLSNRWGENYIYHATEDRLDRFGWHLFETFDVL